MAATRYQILYKMTNPNGASNTMISNKTTQDVTQYIEMYQDQHKIEVGTIDEKMEATNELNERIHNSSDPMNEKYSTLYQYTGTKRINKKVWIPETEGYVIRDYASIKSQITDAYTKEDYSGNFLLLDGTTPESGVVVCKKDYFEKNYVKTINSIQVANDAGNYSSKNLQYVATLDNSLLAKNKSYFEDYEELKEALFSKTIADIDFETYKFEVGTVDTSNTFKQTTQQAANAGHRYLTGTDATKGFFLLNTYGVDAPEYESGYYSHHYSVSGYCNLSVRVGDLNDLTGSGISGITTVSSNSDAQFINSGRTAKIITRKYADALNVASYEYAIANEKMGCCQAIFLLEHVKKYKIPAHYEDVIDYPYCIYDAYEKVEQEPWFEYRICDSLTDALTIVKGLIEKIGFENVKLVKLVPTGQFIKIK